MDQPSLHFTDAPGVRLAHFEWHADRRGQGPTVWLVHATGFHGRVWDQAVRRLPAERHVIAIEQRCHGRSAPVPFDHWRRFGEDQAAQIDALGIRGAIGVGHSMGGHALVQAATLRPGAFSRLILVDPVMVDPAAYQLPPVPLGELHPASQRKNHFTSPQAMFDRFADRPPYAVFQRDALMDYCQHGLRHADNGHGYELCCAPKHEGQVYPLARNFPETYDLVRALDIPVLVVRARAQDPSVKPWDPLGSPTWPGLAAEFPRGTDLFRADKTHFLPMEDPALMAQLIEGDIAALDKG
jgi:pimeloyl-ACP methyl ester carboxylesterase